MAYGVSRPYASYSSAVAVGSRAKAGRWTAVGALEVIVEGFVPVRIKHRDTNSPSTQQPDLSSVAAESALLSKVSFMARTTVF